MVENVINNGEPNENQIVPPLTAENSTGHEEISLDSLTYFPELSQ